MERITINGLTFKVTEAHDEGMGAPWEENDGHGVVTEWVTRDKKPSERVLSKDRNYRRFYDVKASTEIAIRDSWGCEGSEGKTKGQIAAEAVNRDFEYLRAWCSDEWYWMYIQVQLLDTKGRIVPGFSESIGGVESAEDTSPIVRELAETLASRIGEKAEICIPVRSSEKVI